MHLPGSSIEGKHCFDFRQLQPRRLLFLDLLDVQIVKVVGQLFLIRQQCMHFLASGKGDDGVLNLL